MLHALSTVIRPDQPLFSYLEAISKKANNIYNASLFRQRQVMTGTHKIAEGTPLTDHENEIMEEIKNTLPLMHPRFEMPTEKKWILSYEFLDCLLKRSKNPDYYCEGFPVHCAQQMIKNSCRDMKAFWKASAAYNANPDAFTGKPKLPGYHKKGGCCTFFFTNQQCVIHNQMLRFPSTDLKLDVSKFIREGWKLKQVDVVPYYDSFKLTFIVDDMQCIPEKPGKNPERICAIDLGVRNFAAVTNNIGMPCLLFKGGVAKSINRLYNKEYAKIQSSQTTGTKQKFVSTPELERLCQKRDVVLNDFMHKVAKRIIDWCSANGIDTVVVGENKGWKQSVTMGKKENQKFVQLPYTRFKKNLQYLCDWHGIAYVTQEESYTSQASFLDQDPIPVYGCKKTEPVFSGKRSPTKYGVQIKKDGFRGLYRTNDGTIINADLNGSANIGRKAFPEQFTPEKVNFSNPLICRHPDNVFFQSVTA